MRDDWLMLKKAADIALDDLKQSNDIQPNPHMCQLLIVGEDHRFQSHLGVDIAGICRAIWRTYFCGVREGGSTIAMQLTRTMTGRREISLKRKLTEIRLAIKITHHFPKEILPSLYLWIAYYGTEMNNFSQACAKLGVNPASATIEESAKLVACLKYPMPKFVNSKRLNQINNRRKYLIDRHNRYFRK